MELVDVPRPSPKEVKDVLPTFTPRNAPSYDPKAWRLRINGLVGEPQSLSIGEILNMEKAQVECDFECVEGWVVPRIRWEGVRVRTVLGTVRMDPAAQFLMFRAGDFSACLPLAEARGDDALLAYSLNGLSLTFEHGAPLRLIYPGQNCYESVKWVHHLEALAIPQEGTGKAIALKRIGRA